MDKRPLPERLTVLLRLCEKSDIRVLLEFDTGRTVPGGTTPDKHGNFDPAIIKQGKKGWHISIDMMVPVDENDNEIIYPTLEEAVGSGLHMLLKHFEG